MLELKSTCTKLGNPVKLGNAVSLLWDISRFDKNGNPLNLKLEEVIEFESSLNQVSLGKFQNVDLIVVISLNAKCRI